MKHSQKFFDDIMSKADGECPSCVIDGWVWVDKNEFGSNYFYEVKTGKFYDVNHDVAQVYPSIVKEVNWSHLSKFKSDIGVNDIMDALGFVAFSDEELK